jgi:hypothetical protein
VPLQRHHDRRQRRRCRFSLCPLAEIDSDNEVDGDIDDASESDNDDKDDAEVDGNQCPFVSFASVAHFTNASTTSAHANGSF